MPYLEASRVKEIREEIKNKFPNFKFSITREHYSGVIIRLMEGTIDFGKTDGSINMYWLKDSYTGEALKMLTEIQQIANKGNGTLVEDGDYGTVPRFYVWVQLGGWSDKKGYEHYKLISKVSKPEPKVKSETTKVNAEGIEIVEYSEKALAIFGNTKPIKDSLKEIGCRFNPFLTRDGQKVAGWIISKKNESELRNLLNA